MRKIACLVTVLVFTLAVNLSAGATTRRSAPSRINLPLGWEAKPPPSDIAALEFAYNAGIISYFGLAADSKDDFSSDMDLVGYARIIKETSAKRGVVVNRQETPLRRTTVAGHPCVEFEMTGEYKDIKVHFRFIMLHFGDYFYKVTCWTTPSHWDEAQGKFDDLIANFQRPSRPAN